MSGLKLAGLYSYPPCNLGFCGAGIKGSVRILADYICGKKVSEAKVRKTLENFEASYPYYKLIARANGIKDPFYYRVIEAYWLGNELLDKVKYSDLSHLILNEFSRPGLLSKKEAEKKAFLIPLQAKPHHSFHVFFIGSITGRVVLTDELLDLCRVGWGKVTKLKIKNEKLKIKHFPLLTKSDKFYLGKKMEKEIDWDKRFLPKVKVGNRVSFHWGRACQVLNLEQEENLLKYTKLNLQAGD